MRPRSTPGTRHVLEQLRWPLVVVVALAATLLAVVGAGGVRSDIGPVTADLSLVPSLDGGTELDLAPLGRMRLDTHAGPLTLSVRVEDVRLDQARALLVAGSARTAAAVQVESDVAGALQALALRSVLVGLAAAAVACAVVFRNLRAVVVGTTAALLALGGTAGAAAVTARPQALAEPTFTGLLSQASSLVGSVRDTRVAFEAYSRRLVELTSNITQLYHQVLAQPVGAGTDTTRILWVSDVHNNPQAYDLMRSLVGEFGVDAVVDTGDSTDLGSAIENRLHAPIAGLPVPYLWVRGNHDSAVTQAYLASLPNVRVLDDGAVTEVAGLRFAGTGDPRYTPVKRVQELPGFAAGELRAAGRQLVQAIEASADPVDVALVHEPTMAEPLFGHVPLVLDGHVHERRSRVDDGTLELTQGSSGGAGLRTLDGAEDGDRDGGGARPLEMSVLHFDPATGDLVAVDDLSVAGLGEHRVTLERRQVSSYLPPADEPAPTL